MSLGFAAGFSCAFFCVPVLLGLASRNINEITPLRNLVYFLAGRFAAYLAIALLVSVIGMRFAHSNVIDFLSRLFIAFLLVFWGIKGFRESDKEKSQCSTVKFSKAVPFIAGLLTGISPCPPFIAGITRVFSLGNIYGGVLFFLGFYLATSLFLIPALSVIFLKYKKELKITASLISILFGFFFVFFAVNTIL